MSIFNNKLLVKELSENIFEDLKDNPYSTDITSSYFGLLHMGKSEEGRQRFMRYFEPAAKDGNLMSQFLLGVCFVEGMAGPEKKQLGISLIDSAAYRESPFALNFMGGMHARGEKELNITKSPEQAYSSFKSAAEIGDMRGQRNVGNCLLKGFGVESDINLGGTYLIAAAKKGDLVARDILGKLITKSRLSEQRKQAAVANKGEVLSLRDNSVKPYVLRDLAGDGRAKDRRVVSMVEKRSARKINLGG